MNLLFFLIGFTCYRDEEREFSFGWKMKGKTKKKNVRERALHSEPSLKKKGYDVVHLQRNKKILKSATNATITFLSAVND